jgi:hypothetical protein
MVDVPLRHRPGTQRPAVGLPPAAKGRREPRVAPAIRRPRWPRVLFALLLIMGGVFALGYGVRFAINGYRASLTLTGLSDDPSPVGLTVASEALAIPGNMLRETSARAGGPLKQADLVLHWPSLEGYTQLTAADFIDGSPWAPMVYATVAQRSVALDPASRLEGVYARYFVGEPLTAPPRLTARRLSADSGYSGEIVYFGPPGGDRFVARCLAEATAETPATCIRDINFGRNLTLLYRFNREIIGEWEALDAGMRALAGKILAAP